MPRQHETKIPQKLVEKAVRRRLEGNESVVTLAKEYKVSVPTVYNWITAAKKHMVEQARTADLSPRELERTDKLTLIAQVEALKLENKQLRERLVALMLRTDPLVMNDLPAGEQASGRKRRVR
jgi:transposase-like protein